jgi:16S rRNA G966 N2-methylase RsmD
MALEEGAAAAAFVEKDRNTFEVLSKSLQKCPQATAWHSSTEQFLSRTPKTAFDIVFADPPFALWSNTTFETLGSAVLPWLHSESIFLVKHPSRVVASVPPAGYRIWKQSIFGEAGLAYFRLWSA